MYSYGPPHMAEQKQDDQLEHTYSSYVRIRDVALKTCLRWWTIGKSGERGSGISVLVAWHDDDDDISHTLFSKVLMLVVCERWTGDGDRLLYWPKVLLSIAALISHLDWGCSTVGHWRPKALCRHLVSNWLQLARTASGTWLYNCLTTTCFRCSSAYLHRCISWLTARSRVNILHSLGEMLQLLKQTGYFENNTSRLPVFVSDREGGWNVEVSGNFYVTTFLTFLMWTRRYFFT